MPLIILIHVLVYHMLHGSTTATKNYCAQTACTVYSLQTASKYVIFIW